MFHDKAKRTQLGNLLHVWMLAALARINWEHRLQNISWEALKNFEKKRIALGEKCIPYWDAILTNLEFQIICTIHLVKLRGSFKKLYDNGTNPSVHSSDLILRKLLTILSKCWCRQIGLQPYFGRNPIFSCDTDLFKSRNKGHYKHRRNGIFPVFSSHFFVFKACASRVEGHLEECDCKVQVPLVYTPCNPI